MAKKLWDQFGGINALLLTAYIWAALTIEVFVMRSGHISGKGFLVYVFVILFLSMAAAAVLIRVLKKISFVPKEKTVSRKLFWKRFGLFFALAFLGMVIWYLGFYPGAFPSDCIDQFTMIQSGEYSDWHPVLQTIITIGIPYWLTHNVGAIVLFQMIEYAAVLAYMGTIVMTYSSYPAALAVMIWTMVNPVTGLYAVFPLKDICMAIFLVPLMCMGVRVWFEGGEWIGKSGRQLICALLFVIGTLVRHNAILFTAPCMLAIFLHCNRKTVIRIVVMILILFLVFRVGLYKALDVKSPGNRHVETLGLPLSVIGTSVAEDPESLDEETLEFAYQLAPKGLWESVYTVGKFNSIKWFPQTNLNVVEEAGTGKVLKIMLNCFRESPMTAARGLFFLTDVVYTLDGVVDWERDPYTQPNQYGIEIHQNALSELLLNYKQLTVDTALKYGFWFLGIMNLLVVAAAMAKCKLNTVTGWKKLMFALPMLCYNFGTMLLLTGNEFRYFYYSYAVFPLVMIVMLQNRQTDNDNNG